MKRSTPLAELFDHLDSLRLKSNMKFMHVAYKLRFVPIILGVVFASFSFLLLASRSIPYQDPTPEMLVHQATQISNAQLMVGAGIVLMVFGIVYYLVIRHLNKKNSAN